MAKKCVFAGSFDPPTLGHKAVMEDCLKMFDEVVVAVLINPAKTPFFTVEQRLEMLRLTVEGIFQNTDGAGYGCGFGACAQAGADKNAHTTTAGAQAGGSLIERAGARVKIVAFEGTVAELLEKEGTKVYVRGVRNTVDFEYENANFFASKKLDSQLTAVYLPCRQELLHVSSGMVRNSLAFGTPIDEYVTKEVQSYIFGACGK